MTNLLICASITNKEEELELTEGSNAIIPQMNQVDLQHIEESTPTFDPTFIIPHVEDSKKTVNFSAGILYNITTSTLREGGSRGTKKMG